jgi:hypothetical protein
VGSAATYCQDVDSPELPDAASNADMFELGGHPTRWPWGTMRGPAISIALAALLAGLLLGFFGGYREATANGRPGPQAASSAAASGAAVFAGSEPAIADTRNQCAVQLGGDRLQLGIEIVNQSDRTVALRQIEPVLPIGGMQEVASQWATCGALPEPGAGQPTALGPGTTAWLTVTFDVLVKCPQPLPVLFRISYAQAGIVVVTEVNGFSDLTQVQFGTC